MTYLELTTYNKEKVRGNPNLTLNFISAYKTIFRIVPNCTGCSIGKEINNLYQSIKLREDLHDVEIDIDNIQKNNQMIDNNKTFEKSILLKEDMIAYRDSDGRIRRKFTNKLNDEFVIGYLINGTPEEIEERKKKFKVLPLALREETQEETQVVEITEEQPKQKRKRKSKK